MGTFFRTYTAEVPEDLRRKTVEEFTSPVYSGDEFIALLNEHGIFYYMCSNLVDLEDYQKKTGFCIVEKSGTYPGYYIGRGLYHTTPVYGLLGNAVAERDIAGMEKNLTSFMEFDREKAWLDLDSDFKTPFTARGCQCYYIQDYYKQARNENKRSVQGAVNNHIFRFKTGSASVVTAKLLAMAVQKSGIIKDPADTVLLCVAASTRERQEKRFRQFSALLSGYLGIMDGYDIVRIEYDRRPGDARRGMPVTENIRLNDYGEALKDKHLIICDDVYTSGKSFAGWVDYLSTADAESITGIFFARTANF